MVEITPNAMDDLRTAFEQATPRVECYLDTETGKVLWFSDYDTPFDGEPGPEDPEWVHRAWRKRMRVWKDERGRYLEVPPGDPRDNLQDMQAYLEQCDSEPLQENFGTMSMNRHAFQAFRHAVDRDPLLRKKWRKFRRECLRDRVEEWLEVNGYRLVIEEE